MSIQHPVDHKHFYQTETKIEFPLLMDIYQKSILNIVFHEKTFEYPN